MKVFIMLSFLKFANLMELLQLVLILKRHHVLVNQDFFLLLLCEKELTAAQFKLIELTIIESIQDCLICRPNLFQNLVCIPYKKIGY